MIEAATGLGMTPGERLRLVELPLAFPVVLAGIRIAVVVGVGLATIAAAIGAGGLGVLIYRGVATVDHRLILAGAVPAALLALAFDFGLGAVEKRWGRDGEARLAARSALVARARRRLPARAASGRSASARRTSPSR